MCDQESNETGETHISQPQWLLHDFIVGTALEEGEPSSPTRKLDHIGKKENAPDDKKRCVGLPEEEKEDYKASGAKLSLHGMAYQWKLLMLFAYNSHKLGYDFHLATEMIAAEKFDDVVLQYTKAGSDVKHWRFLQAKHSQKADGSKKITANDLLTKKDKNFSLQKYFLSFQKIKRNKEFQSGELQDFILCTNGDFDFDNGFQHQSLKKLRHQEPLYLEPVNEADEMFNVGGERYRFASSSHPERQAVLSMLKSIFDETSECRKLAKMLAEHLLEGKMITFHGLFEHYHMPLASFVFDMREKKLAKEFVEGKFDDQSCPGALAFREALYEAIVESLKEQPEKQNNLLPKAKKLIHHCTDSDALWNDIGELELKLADNFRYADLGLKELSELQVTDEEVGEFLDRLIFAVNQPNEKSLSELISDKLGEELNIIDGDFITSDFQSRMLDWLKEKQGRYQSQGTMGKFFCDLREKVYQLILIGPTSEHVKTLQEYEIEFDDNALPAALKKFLQDETSVFNYITDTTQTFLGSIKVNQVMKDISAYKAQGSFIFVSLKNLLLLEEKPLMAFRKDQSKLLILECKEETADEIKTLFSKLSEIIKERHGKKVILIAPCNHPLASQFQTGEHKTLYQEMVDEFQFGDLTSDSQEKLLKKTVKFQGIEIALNELMSADSALTKTLPLVSLTKGMKLEFGQPVPVSIGYDEVFFIGRTLNYQSEENPTSYSTENLDNLMLQAQRQVFLISDTAGMGKTTLLTHLSKQIKQKDPSLWVVRIDLNDHTHTLKAQNEQKIKAVEFLSQKLLKIDSPFEKELFEQRFKEGKVVVMLDGFDEICPSYETTVVHLLQTLKKTPVRQLWVTTRPHLRKTLEEYLQQHSYTLEPFTKGNQVEFLTKFWNKELNLQGTSQQQLEMYATAIIEKLEQSINDRDKEFTGVPLQTRLLAEAFDQSALSGQNLPDKLDLLDLYKSFTKRKYNIYFEEKMKMQMSNVPAEEQRECFSKNFTEVHQYLALQMLFPKEVIETFKDNIQPEFNPQLLTRCGIVLYTDNKPHFIHRIFAEYYVADILIDKLSKETTPEQGLLDFFLKDILLKENCQVICSFLDGFLENCKVSRGILEQSGQRISELWTDDADGGIRRKPLGSFGRTILHQAARVGHTHIIRYVLDSLKAGQHLETMRDLFLAKDGMGQTAWHLSVENGHLETSEELWDRSKETKLNLKDELLFAKDDNRRTAYHLAAWNKHPQVLEKLREWAEAELSQQELQNLLLANDKEGKTAWHLSVENGHLETSEELWDWAKEAKLNLKVDLLLAEDTNRQTACHLAAWNKHPHVLKKLLDCAEEAELSQQELKNLLLANDMEGQTVWHLAAWENNPQVFQNLMEWAEKANIDQHEFKALLLQKDYRGQTPWHFATWNNHHEVYEWVTKVIENPQEQKELLKELFLNKDKDEQTIWHLAAQSIHPDVFEKLLDEAYKALSKEELLSLLQTKNMMGRTAWHLSAENGAEESLNTLWEWAKKVHLEQNELKNNWLLSQDSRGSAWHLAAHRGHVTVLKKLWDWATEMNLKLKEDLLLFKDVSGRNAGHLAAERRDTETIEEILHWAKQANLKFSADFLLDKDRNGQTPLELLKNSFYVRTH